MRLLMAAFCLLVGTTSFAQEGTGSDVAGTTTEPVDVLAPATQKIFGEADIRPSFEINAQSRWLNGMEAGYQWSPDTKLSYKQEFTVSQRGEFTGRDGYVKGVFDRLWDNGDGLTFNYEPRLVFPTDLGKRNAGLTLSSVHYLKFKKQFGNHFVALHTAPMLHVYNRSGQGDVANPIFENQLTLLWEFFFIENRLKIAIPLMFHQTRYAAFRPGARNNDAWGYLVWLYPEVEFRVSPFFALGAGYFTANLVTADLSSFTLGDGFSKGTVQAIVKANF